MNRNMLDSRPGGDMPVMRWSRTWIQSCPWGGWKTLNEGEGFKVKLLEIHPGRQLSLQYHHHRSEFWVVVAGRVNAIVGGRSMELIPQQSVLIPRETAHRLGNSGYESALVVEVQYGDILSEDDIVRLEDDYGRANKVSDR